MNSFKFRDLKKIYAKNTKIKSTKSPHFPLRGKVVQLSKRKRDVCWSISLLFLVDGSGGGVPAGAAQHLPQHQEQRQAHHLHARHAGIIIHHTHILL